MSKFSKILRSTVSDTQDDPNPKHNSTSALTDFKNMQRAIENPTSETMQPDTVLQLQGTIGNRSVLQLLRKSGVATLSMIQRNDTWKTARGRKKTTKKKQPRFRGIDKLNDHFQRHGDGDGIGPSYSTKFKYQSAAAAIINGGYDDTGSAYGFTYYWKDSTEQFVVAKNGDIITMYCPEKGKERFYEQFD